MNMPEDALHHIHLTDDCLLGHSEPDGGLDLMNILLVELAKDVPDADAGRRLHRLLGTLFSRKMKGTEKQKVIHEEYGIPLESGIGKEADIMCNLSERIEEEALARGREEGEARGREEGEAKGRKEGEAKGRKEGEAKLILTMHRKGCTAEQIAEMTDKSVEEIVAIIAFE